jgi:hypothetical protein
MIDRLSVWRGLLALNGVSIAAATGCEWRFSRALSAMMPLAEDRCESAPNWNLVCAARVTLMPLHQSPLT